MRGNEGGELVLAVQARNQFKNRFRRMSVEVSRGLIGQQQLRTGDERAGQSHPLLLSARKLA